MPQVKLTLSADMKIVEQAKKIARDKNTSVSSLFSEYIKAVADLQEYNKEIGPVTKKALGIVTLPGDKSDKELLEEALWEKHGKKR